MSDLLAKVERLKAKLLGTDECLETWKSAAEKWEAEVAKLDAEIERLKAAIKWQDGAVNAGMERAAVIADTHHMAGGKIIAAAIRVESV